MSASQQEVNHILTLGAALGAALGNSCRLRQGGLGHALCCRGGFILDDNHRGLGSLRRSLGQRPEKERVQSKANQIQDKTKKIEELQEQQRILLFFFLVGAEHGEIEVRLASGATRRRSRLPCPLGRSSSGGPGRPRSSCSSSVRHSRGNIACRGGACCTAWRLLACLPPRYVPGPAETPSGWSWGLRLRRAA